VAASILFSEIYGVDSAEIYRYADRLREITAEDIRSLAERLFDQPFVLCAVGPKKPW
jgi:predicted Zn-dependent peptidase